LALWSIDTLSVSPLGCHLSQRERQATSIFVVMLICRNSTGLCKPVEFFVYTKFIPDLSTVFSLTLVEKPVENVDNSQIKAVLHTMLF